MDIAQLKILLRIDEGEKLRPYKDSVGKITIGVGRNLDDVGISKVESDFLLTNDIQKVQLDLNKEIPWWILLSDNRQMVLANMAFNMGIGGLLQFTHMLMACKDSKFSEAARQMLDSKWAAQVGQRAIRLAQLMERG